MEIGLHFVGDGEPLEVSNVVGRLIGPDPCFRKIQGMEDREEEDESRGRGDFNIPANSNGPEITKCL